MRASQISGHDLRLELGEGPVWDATRSCVWWVDSEAGDVFRGTLEGTSLTVELRISFDEKVGSVTPAQDGGLLVAGEREVHVLDADGNRRSSIRVIPQGQASRLNDGSVDPAGRFLVGSIRLDDRVAQESVWAIESDRSVREVLGGVTVSNGIGFAPDGRTMYHVETRPGAIRAMDYDVETGIAGAPRDVLASGGTPDGLAVDAEGCLWVAFFGEACVRRLSPAGDIIDVIEVGIPNVTCPEFVGPGLAQLLITTARFRMTPEALEAYPSAGTLVVATPDVPGLPVRPWAGSTR